jgi:hypothetical protein
LFRLLDKKFLEPIIEMREKERSERAGEREQEREKWMILMTG